MELKLAVVLSVYCFGIVTCDEFNCPSLPPLTQPAQSVHQLRPQDIKVVMALGDSITAGFGAMGRRSIFKDLLEYRGISWSIGGDPNATTIASFLKHYSSNITGASIGSHFGEFCGSVHCYPLFYKPKQDVFNAAQTGAFVKDIQFSYLLKQITNNPSVDIERDWKLMTILIGFNDVCAICAGRNITAGQFESNLRDLLEEIRLNIPHIFINLVELFNLSIVYDKTKDVKYCTEFHKILPVDCHCLWTGGIERRQVMDSYVVQFNEIIRKIAKDYSVMKYDDFAVINQPGIRDITSETIPLDFLSTLDCFHPSLKGHAAFAKTIWNNMLTAEANKATSFDINLSYKCPTNDTLLYTY